MMLRPTVQLLVRQGLALRLRMRHALRQVVTGTQPRSIQLPKEVHLERTARLDTLSVAQQQQIMIMRMIVR